MKKITLLIFILMASLGFAQVDMPYDFETTPVTADVIAFDGATATVEPVAAPQSTGNTSTNLLKIVRDGGQPWAGAFILTATDFDFAAKPYIVLNIWTEAPIGSQITLKSENSGDGGNNSGDQIQLTTKTAEWETLVWDFSAVTNMNQNKFVIIPDLTVVGDGTAASTFYFDDIQNVATLSTKSIEIAGLSAYPNPSQDSWTVKTQNIKMSSIEVFDILGKSVISLKPEAVEARIDASQLKSGLYFAKIYTDKGFSSLKLVRQ